MATDVNKNVSDIKTAQDKLVDSRGKLSRFSYTEEAYVNNEAFGVASYNYANEQNVPLGTTEAMETNASVVNKGFREQASSVARQLMNHFFGRTSFNLNKINDYFNSLLVQFLRHLSQDDNAYSATAVYVPDDICFVLDASHNKRTFRYVGTVAESGHAPLNNDGTINTNYWAEINVSTVNGKTGKVTLYGTDVAIASNNASTVGSALSGITGNPNSANGTVKLDSNGRVPYDQLPESTMNYMGDWNAKTNTPTLKNGTGVKGEFYLVTVAGTWNGIEFTVNDRIIYNGTEWRKMEGGSVNSVNNQSPTNGNVTLTGDNINTSVTLQDKTTQTQTVQTAINNKQSTPVEITQANYNKLTSTQRQKNLYIITDAPETEDTYINDNVTANDTAWSSNKVVSHVNGALVDYAKSITSNVLNTKVAHYSIEFEHKNYCSTSLLFAMRGGNSVIVNIGIGDGNAVQTPQAIYSQKIDNQTMSVNFKTNGSYKADLYISSSVYAQYLNVSNLIPSSAKVTFVEALDSLPEGTSAITVKEGVTQTDLNGALADYEKYKEIANSTDIDTVKEQGLYHSKGYGHNCTNTPNSDTNNEFILEVFYYATNNTNAIFQRFTSRSNNKVYIRKNEFIGSGNYQWKAWEEVAFVSDVNGALADYEKHFRLSKNLSAKGWYRIAQLNNGLTNIGNAIQGIIQHFDISSMYNNSGNESYCVTMGLQYHKATFKSNSMCSTSNPLFTKIRYVSNGSGVGYVDIYYNLTTGNDVYIDFSSKNFYAINFTSIAETVSGETVYGESLLSDYVSSTLTNYQKIKKISLSSNQTLTLTHNTSVFAIKITVQGANGYRYGCFQYQGYGNGQYDHIFELLKGTSFTYTMENNTLSFTANSTTYVVIEYLLGDETSVVDTVS